MVREGDATLTGRMSYYRGACGLEEHVGRMDIQEGEAGMADTGRCANGVGVGKAARKFQSTHWCL